MAPKLATVTSSREDTTRSSSLPPREAPQDRQYGLKMFAAATSNGIASAITNPVDVIKVRQQLRVAEKGVARNGPTTFWAVGTDIVRSEGATRLMAGTSATLLRELVYSSIRLGAYDYFKDVFYEAFPGQLSKDGLALKVAGASVAGSLGAWLANPTDLVKTRMQRYHPGGPGQRAHAHVWDAFRVVYTEGSTARPTARLVGGLDALWRGAGATTVRALVLSTSQICAYDQTKQTLREKGIMKEGLGLHFVASFLAGLICTVTSTPVDVVKVRIHSDKERQYNGVLDCVKKTFRNEGALAFWKGFSMNWARLGTHTVLTFILYERTRTFLGIRPM